MKTIAKLNRTESWSALGIVVGMGMLVAGLVSNELGSLALPAVVVLLPSLLHGMR